MSANLDHPPAPAAPPSGLDPLLGCSAPMERLYAQLRRIAPTPLPVLVLGESGTGKELVARAVHDLSPRRAAPFVPVNCGAIPATLIEAELLGHERGSFTGAERRRAGYFEHAHGGTLLLDEVGEMPVAMQIKLLRVLEGHSFHRVGGSEPVTVDVRVVAASNRDLRDAVRDGRFREDLMYRLSALPVRVPALRERPDDIPLLARHFLDELNAREGTRKTFSRQCLKEFALHTWPGNVRELKNAVSRAFILADRVIDRPFGGLAPAWPTPLRRDACLEVRVGTPLAQAQRALILATLERFGGNKGRAAAALGVSLKTLYNRLELYRATARGA
ncbi:MAG: sigma-54-dependent Fis family transcriptional regulator [Gammaproteobacteria bacterium]|nr:sigma-54-dependent Fis family transcriptional regulator [Gammaproteobacteria bacterium]